MDTMEAIASRQSCRAYSGQQLTEKELDLILAAANAAPVARKIYENVKLTVIQDRDFIAKIEAAAYGASQQIGEHPTYGAPTLILVCGKNGGERTKALAYCNASCIMENMMLAATDLGLGSVYLFAVPYLLADNAEFYAAAKVPAGFFPVTMMGVGKAAQEAAAKPLTRDNIVTDFIR
jgi:nitroreductase